MTQQTPDEDLTGYYAPYPPIVCMLPDGIPGEPGHDAGPSVAECRDADRAWAVEQEGD